MPRCFILDCERGEIPLAIVDGYAEAERICAELERRHGRGPRRFFYAHEYGRDDCRQDLVAAQNRWRAIVAAAAPPIPIQLALL